MIQQKKITLYNAVIYICNVISFLTDDNSFNNITNLGINSIDVNVPRHIKRLLGLGIKCALKPSHFNIDNDYQDLIKRIENYGCNAGNYDDHNKFISDYNFIDKMKEILTLHKDKFNKIKYASVLKHNDIKKLYNYSKLFTIQPADKGLGLTIMTNEKYLELANPTIKQYMLIDKSSAILHINHLYESNKNYITSLLYNNGPRICGHDYIRKRNAINYIIESLFPVYDKDKKHIPVIYFMPKLHKNPISMRPIVAAHSWLLNPIAKIATVYYRHYTKDSAIIINSSTELINRLQNLSSDIINNNHILASADITNLYGEIPLNEFKDIFNSTTPHTYFKPWINDHFPLHTLHKIINHCTEITLNNCFIEFNNKIYKQNKGIPMGSPFGPTLANLFLHFKFDHILQSLKGIKFICRYLDDIFFIVEKEHMNNITILSNKIHHAMQLNFEIGNSINFLDLTITLDGNKINTKPFVKPSNKLLYLPANSFHSYNTKKGFIITELKRLIRCSSTYHAYHIAATNFAKALITRGYTKNIILHALLQVNYKDRQTYLNPSTKTKINNIIHVAHLNKHTINNDYQSFINKIMKNAPKNSNYFGKRILTALKKAPTIRSLIIHNHPKTSLYPIGNTHTPRIIENLYKRRKINNHLKPHTPSIYNEHHLSHHQPEPISNITTTITNKQPIIALAPVIPTTPASDQLSSTVNINIQPSTSSIPTNNTTRTSLYIRKPNNLHNKLITSKFTSTPKGTLLELAIPSVTYTTNPNNPDSYTKEHNKQYGGKVVKKIFTSKKGTHFDFPCPNIHVDSNNNITEITSLYKRRPSNPYNLPTLKRFINTDSGTTIELHRPNTTIITDRTIPNSNNYTRRHSDPGIRPNTTIKFTYTTQHYTKPNTYNSYTR